MTSAPSPVNAGAMQASLTLSVIPTEVGIHGSVIALADAWIPTFVGMTVRSGREGGWMIFMVCSIYDRIRV
jgi:hypothetical protein